MKYKLAGKQVFTYYVNQEGGFELLTLLLCYSIQYRKWITKEGEGCGLE